MVSGNVVWGWVVPLACWVSRSSVAAGSVFRVGSGVGVTGVVFRRAGLRVLLAVGDRAGDRVVVFAATGRGVLAAFFPAVVRAGFLAFAVSDWEVTGAAPGSGTASETAGETDGA